MLPLSGVAAAKIIGCNESGYFSVYETDRYGFRNPVGSWRDAEVIDLAFVGDSYTAGDCVSEGDHFVDHLRGDFPNVLNLGTGGSGPLFELAVIREYLRGRRVSYVFRIYFERNDLMDLSARRDDPILSKYLEPDATQDLPLRHRELDSALRQYVDDRLTAKAAGEARILPNLRLLLWRARHRRGGTQKAAENSSEYDLRILQRIVLAARTTVEELGGRLVFVYLPEYERFSRDTPSAPWSGARLKSRVVQMILSSRIDIIDVENAFRQAGEPLRLFPFGMQGHYNPAGYAIVADEIRRYLTLQEEAVTVVDR